MNLEYNSHSKNYNLININQNPNAADIGLTP